MLADLVAASDSEITAITFEILVERIRAENSACRDFIAVAERSPALDENVGFEKAIGADFNIGLDDAEFADSGSGADAGAGIDSRCGRDNGGGVDGHGFHDSDARHLRSNSGAHQIALDPTFEVQGQVVDGELFGASPCLCPAQFGDS